MIKGLLATVALVAATATAASAQWYPGQYNGQSGYDAQQQRQLQGVVTSFNAFDLYVESGGRGNQYVHLHQGTVINPRGTTLQNGMPVRVLGYVDGGGTFQANEVDVVNNANYGRYGNCGSQQNGYYGSGQYGTGYYQGGNNGSYGNCSNGQWNRGRHRGRRRDGDDDDRGDRDRNQNRNQYPNPYPTYPPNRQ